MSLETINFSHFELAKGQRMLDLGCGEGRHSITAWLLAEVQVIGLDLSKADLSTAQTRLQDFDAPTERIHFIQGSAFSLPFPDNSFDRVICAEVLEHIHAYHDVLREISRVLKPGGVFAVSVPRAWPEKICWWLSDEYHEVAGGHVRIFDENALHQDIQNVGMQRQRKHWAHSLHSPYWWLRCLFWKDGAEHPMVKAYHRFLVWDLMQAPRITRWMDRLLNPVMGKSVVMYYVNKEGKHAG